MKTSEGLRDELMAIYDPAARRVRLRDFGENGGIGRARPGLSIAGGVTPAS